MPARHLLIDGWNLVHAWEDLSLAGVRDSAAAAGVLAARVQPLLRDGRLLVTIVFDGRGDRWESEPQSRDGSFTLVYTPAGVTADAFIERAVGAVSDPESFIVASADQALRTAVFAMGAEVMSPANLALWIERCARATLPKSNTPTASPFSVLDSLNLRPKK